ncbi:guided entry of tail-anchored proteins factor 1 [Drosophila grimshawi]|uniref:GH16143 n=1 Tax=Drosophila grimshawi TaxID=7222 RepID=B4IWL1_DROGR|nr:guided entry of tail-anchored proteins factor 1 [Drosophila grimshawi]EDV94301.1 GH22511 [Drosophila grimshawi]EDV96237.1 GH16143 [Drosophila grimshawi]
MQLFIQIALMCLINTLLPDIIRNYLKISRFWKRTAANTQILQSTLDAAREELDNVLTALHAGEYAKKIKTMRAERKVAEAESNIKMARQMEVIKQSTIDTVAYYVSKVLLSLILIIVCARNRHAPVMVFDDSFSLAPLSGLLSFPTGVYNAISVPVWAFSCNFTFRLLYGLLAKK